MNAPSMSSFACASALGLALGLTACAANTAPPAPQSVVERKVVNERLWPAEASRFVSTGQQAKTCLETQDTVLVVNDEESFIFMNDGDFYLNRLQWKCNNVLINGARVQAAFGRRQICEGISVTLPDRFGGNPNAQCFLGEFEPIRIAQAGEPDAITVNEGQTIRRPR
ncbi:MAG: hypothetical protein AAF291_02520 [Pseudomonadota bacterium]